MIRRLFAVAVVAAAVLTAGSCSNDNNTITGPNPTQTPGGPTATATPPGQATMTPTQPGATPTPTPAGGATRTVLVGAGGGNTFVDQQSGNSTSTIRVGDTIEWTNKDLVPHTATANDGSFDSSAIQPGKKWRFRVQREGEVSYLCRFHPTMLGKVTVE